MPDTKEQQTVADLIARVADGGDPEGEILCAHIAHVAAREYARGYRAARGDMLLAVNELEP